ncbi:MAG TPA: hypothetical protein VKA68_14555, partial [bacterium]|nr:hypothetical protein [bacterium]
MKKFVLILTGIILLVICVVSIWGYVHMRDRHSGYTMDLHIPAAEEGRALRVGFGKQPITPDISETWQDANGDSRYDPEDGDTYIDRNDNGRFDAFWMAGFHNARPARGIHDDLWARALVIDDERTRIGLVVLDVIGFGHDYVLDTRERIMSEIPMDYVLICSTHNHEAPDLIGLWGSGYLKSGVNPDYLEYVKNQTARAVIRAAEAM